MGTFPDNPGFLPATKLCNAPDKGKPNPIQGDGPLFAGDSRRELVKHLQTMLRDLGFKLGDTGDNHDRLTAILADMPSQT